VYNPETKKFVEKQEVPTLEELQAIKESEGDKFAEELKKEADETEEEKKKRELRKLKKKRYQDNRKKKWFEAQVNTFIYV